MRAGGLHLIPLHFRSFSLQSSLTPVGPQILSKGSES